MMQNSNMRYSVTCPLCLTEGVARIGLTKKAMPFVTCTSCASRCFVNSFEALRSITQTDPEVTKCLQRDREDALEAAAETAYPLAEAGERQATTKGKSWVELLQLPSLDIESQDGSSADSNTSRADSKKDFRPSVLMSTSMMSRVLDDETFDREMDILHARRFDAPEKFLEAVTNAAGALSYVTAALDAFVGVDHWTSADAAVLAKVVLEERDRELRREAGES